MRAALFLLAAGAALALPSLAAAQQTVYPAQGQNPEQQQQDEAACSDWARSQSGFDPANPQPPPTAQAAPVTGSGARVRGAAAGAAFGAIGGNAGAGAAAGAAAGGIGRRVRNSNAAQAQNQANAQAGANMQASYLSARAACLSGRGYTVR